MSVSEAKQTAAITDRLVRAYTIDKETAVEFVPSIVTVIGETDGVMAPLADYILANIATKPNRKTAVHVASQILHDLA